MFPTEKQSAVVNVQLSEELSRFVKHLVEVGMEVSVILQTGGHLQCNIRWANTPNKGHTIIIKNSDKIRELPISQITEVLFTPNQLSRIYNIPDIKNDNRCTGLVMLTQGNNAQSPGGEPNYQCIPLRWDNQKNAQLFVSLLHSIEPKLAELADEDGPM